MNKNKLMTAVYALALVAGVTVAGSASAQTGINAQVNVNAGIDARPFDGRAEAKGDFRGEVRGEGKMATSTRPDFDKKGGEGRKDVGRGGVIVGTVTSIDGSVVVVTDKANVAHTVSATSTRFFSATGTTTIEVSALKVGDNVKVVDASLASKVEAKAEGRGFFGRIWSACKSFFGRSDK